MYSAGNIKISKHELLSLLSSIPPGIYSTFDILEKYQGMRVRNKKISVGNSWNAHFGKILKKCALDPSQSKIRQVSYNAQITIDNGNTSTSYWEII